MAEKRTIGLTSIKLGAVGVDGGMGASLAVLGNTFQGTATLTQEDPAENEFFAEEQDDPIEVLFTKGKTTLEFAIVDFTPATMVKVLGGTVSGVAPAEKWEAPTDIPAIEQSIEIITKKNLKIEIPRASVKAKLDLNFSKSEMGRILVSATVLKPELAGTAPISTSFVA